MNAQSDLGDMSKSSGSINLDLVPMALLRLNSVGRVTFSNAAVRELFGEGMDGRLVSDVIRHPEFHTLLRQCLDDRRPSTTRLTLGTRLGAGHFDVGIACEPGAGTPDEVIVAFNDQSALEQANAIRRDFVANVSHELRTPLTALVGFIETLRGAARDDTAARERFLGIMDREANRMIRLVNDLLSLSRVEADEFRRPSDSVDLLALLRAVIFTQRDMATRSGVTMTLTSAQPEVKVRGDSDQLTQVFLNLAENGIKYGGSGGRLDFVVTRLEREPKLRGPAVVVEVSDNGEGIDPIHLPRLTERFYRVDDHRSQEKGGTGLGLAIVKHIVNRHRGRLRIESEPGKGSKFKVILPES